MKWLIAFALGTLLAIVASVAADPGGAASYILVFMAGGLLVATVREALHLRALWQSQQEDWWHDLDPSERPRF